MIGGDHVFLAARALAGTTPVSSHSFKGVGLFPALFASSHVHTDRVLRFDLASEAETLVVFVTLLVEEIPAAMVARNGSFTLLRGVRSKPRAVGLTATGTDFVVRAKAAMVTFVVVTLQAVGAEVRLFEKTREGCDDIVVLVVVVEDQQLLIFSMGRKGVTGIMFLPIDDDQTVVRSQIILEFLQFFATHGSFGNVRLLIQFLRQHFLKPSSFFHGCKSWVVIIRILFLTFLFIRNVLGSHGGAGSTGIILVSDWYNSFLVDHKFFDLLVPRLVFHFSALALTVRWANDHDFHLEGIVHSK